MNASPYQPDRTERRAPRGKWLRMAARNDRGGAMIEFALVAVPLLLVLFAIIEVGFVMWGTIELENATEDAARLIRTGEAQTTGLDAQELKARICERTTVLFDCTSRLKLDVRSYDEFGSLTTPEPLDSDGGLKDDFTFNPGGSNDVVLVSAFFEWPLINIVSSAGLSNMASGNRLIRASAVIRNEPFPEN